MRPCLKEIKSKDKKVDGILKPDNEHQWTLKTSLQRRERRKGKGTEQRYLPVITGRKMVPQRPEEAAILDQDAEFTVLSVMG